MQAVRFELTKQIAQDLKSCPFDRSGTLAFDTIWSLSIWGLEPQALRLEALRAIHCAIQTCFEYIIKCVFLFLINFLKIKE